MNEELGRAIEAARARVEALYADARNQGLREISRWLSSSAMPSHPESTNTFVSGYLAATKDTLDKIDAMLGGDGE